METIEQIQQEETPVDNLAILTENMGFSIGEIEQLTSKGTISIADMVAHMKHRSEYTIEELGLSSDETTDDDEPTEKKPRVTQAQLLLQLFDAIGADVFHDTVGDLYTSYKNEILLIESRDCKNWLSGLFYKQCGKTPNKESITQVIAVLSARARFDKPDAIPLSVRVAERDGAFFYDLADSKWKVIKVTPGGWTVCNTTLPTFIRYRHQMPQVMPQPGGDVRLILKYIPITRYSTLFLCWLVSCFVPDIPHPSISTHGEKGSAKTTVNSFQKMVIDPSALETLSLQSDPRALAVNFQQHYFMPFDNVGGINAETSDMLCRVITGGGIQQRKLYTNGEDFIFTFLRVVSINGINIVVNKPDLLDRSILIELERIPESERRELAEIRAAFEADRPAILGGIFDVLSKAMQIYPGVKLKSLPRMADFCRWGYAIGEAMGGLGQTFLDEYAANRESQNLEAINADAVATLIVEFMSDKTEWSGTMTTLFNRIKDTADEHGINTRNKYFPSDSARLAKRIRGIKSNLEAVGIFIEYDRDGEKRTISLKYEKIPSLPSQPSLFSNINALQSDSKASLPSHDDSTVIENDSRLLLPSQMKPLQRNGYDNNDGNDGKKATLRGRI